MLKLTRLAAALALLGPTPAPAQPTTTVRVHDDFQADTRKAYAVTGTARWQKGALLLDAGARLRREVALGAAVEVQATVSFAGEPAAGQFALVLIGSNRSERVEFALQGDKAVLRQRAAVPAEPSPVPAQGERRWVVRLRLNADFLAVKTWPARQPEPTAWLSRGYAWQTDWPGVLDWQPEAVALEAGPHGALHLHALTIKGSPHLRLSPEQRAAFNRAAGLSLAGLGLTRTGNFSAAAAKLRDALGHYEKALPAGHPRVAIAWGYLAGVFKEQGHWDEARDACQRSLAIMQKALPPDHPKLAAALHNLGTILMNQGRLEDGRSYLERALAISTQSLPPNHSDLPFTLNNLGYLLYLQGFVEEARGYLERAVAVRKKTLAPTHPDLAQSMVNLGSVLRDLGKWKEAAELFRQGAAIYEKALPPGHPDRAATLIHLAWVLQAQGRLAEARQLFQTALSMLEKALPADHPRLAIASHSLGALLYALGEPGEGWRHLRAAVRSHAAHYAAVAAGSAQADHSPLLRAQATYLHTLLSAAAAADLAPAARQELFDAVLESKVVSTALVAHRQRRLLESSDAATRADFERLLDQRRRLANLLLQGAGSRPPQQYRQDCDQARREADELERTLAQRVKALGDWRQAHRAGAAELAERLEKRAVLIELVRYIPQHVQPKAGVLGGQAARYAALLLWRGAEEDGPQTRFLDVGPAQPLEQAIAAWRQQVQRGATETPTPEDEAAGSERIRKGEVDKLPGLALRTLLWEPLARALPPGTERLVIAPEGALALLPFEALRLAGGKYLVESMKISYVATGRDLMPQPQSRARSEVALILADPAYDATGQSDGGAAQGLRAGVALPKGVRFRALPGFAREADAVAQLLRGQRGWQVEARRGEAATEEALALVKRPRLLYGITHGFFLKDVERPRDRQDLRDLEVASLGPSVPRLPNFGEDPRLRSGLALTGANKWQERSAKGLSDGLLTALEVENLDLWGTELVVLSACETGLGEVQVGEGVLGLRRAFQLAGAQTVVASLWKVPDAETQQLMTAFLGRWLRGEGKAEALRAAQLDLIRTLRQSPSAARREAPPLYWAGFICHGQAK